MTSERWQQIEHLLQEALEYKSAERAAFLERECAGDTALREEVESLIASAQPAQSFLNANALEDATVLFVDSESESLIGHQIGHYLIQKQLGSGGMGEVYLAQDIGLERRVALKLVDPTVTGDSATRARFLREARLASALDHPNICTIHEVGEAEGRLFIAMQYVEGETLRRVIGGRPLSLDSLLSIALQVADALSAAHAQGIIHRDI
ncbi:MAG TPA: serine/threonine-protein kinase, partial [Pyrinomonadaceae bacterium]|nr:serine/threonine-protein kinase [Pyrinomonadaceae bacterium]